MCWSNETDRIGCERCHIGRGCAVFLHASLAAFRPPAAAVGAPAGDVRLQCCPPPPRICFVRSVTRINTPLLPRYPLRPLALPPPPKHAPTITPPPTHPGRCLHVTLGGPPGDMQNPHADTAPVLQPRLRMACNVREGVERVGAPGTDREVPPCDPAPCRAAAIPHPNRPTSATRRPVKSRQ